VGPRPLLSPEAEVQVSDAVTTGKFGPPGRFGIGSPSSTVPVHRGWSLQSVEAAEVWRQSAPSGACQGRPGIAGSLEKGGLQQGLAAAAVSQERALGLADADESWGVGLRAWCFGSGSAVG
jgi:hypothetical protein